MTTLGFLNNNLKALDRVALLLCFLREVISLNRFNLYVNITCSVAVNGNGRRLRLRGGEHLSTSTTFPTISCSLSASPPFRVSALVRASLASIAATCLWTDRSPHCGTAATEPN
eukprot:6206916-Pleurochrysis_carterae.AAC.1